MGYQERFVSVLQNIGHYLIMEILLIISIFAVFLSAVCQLVLRKTLVSIAVTIAAISYCAILFLGFARFTGFLPEVDSRLTSQAIAYMHTYLQDSVYTMTCGFLIALNVFVTCCIWWHMRLSYFIIVIVTVFLIVGCLISAFANYSPLITLFGTCCAFMAVVGYAMGLTYEEFCVIGNNYLQAFFVLLSSIWLCLNAWINNKQKPSVMNWISSLTSSFLVLLYLLMFVSVCKAYPPPLEYAFHVCVKDLYCLADCWHTTYYHVNILIYVIAFIASIATNVLTVFLLKKSKTIKGLVLMTIHLIVFLFAYLKWPM